MREDVIARVGTRIVCPNIACAAEIAKFAKTLLAGAPDIGIDILEFHEGQKRDAGSQAICFKCGTPFWRASYRLGKPLPVHELHTKDGWLKLTGLA